MAQTFLSHIAICALLCACTFAFWKGQVAERLGAAIICTSWVSEYLLSMLFKDASARDAEELILLVTDGALALGMLFLAFKFAKLWLGVAMLMLSGELALHGAAMGDWGFQFGKYIYLNNALSYGQLAVLVVATTLAWTRRGETAGENPPPRLPSEQF